MGKFQHICYFTACRPLDGNPDKRTSHDKRQERCSRGDGGISIRFCLPAGHFWAALVGGGFGKNEGGEFGKTKNDFLGTF